MKVKRERKKMNVALILEAPAGCLYRGSCAVTSAWPYMSRAVTTAGSQSTHRRSVFDRCSLRINRSIQSRGKEEEKRSLSGLRTAEDCENMSAEKTTNPCNKFQANIFNKSKCQNCFKSRELHLLTDHDMEQVMFKHTCKHFF